MKVVLDIGWSPEDRKSGADCVLVDASAYVNRCDEPPHYKGGYASLTVHGRNKEGAVQIDDSIEDIRNVLTQGLRLLDVYEAHFRDEKAEARAHAEQCSVCSAWFDRRKNGHADGKGNTCFGENPA